MDHGVPDSSKPAKAGRSSVSYGSVQEMAGRSAEAFKLSRDRRERSRHRKKNQDITRRIR
jgi:hypothetical protein